MPAKFYNEEPKPSEEVSADTVAGDAKPDADDKQAGDAGETAQPTVETAQTEIPAEIPAETPVQAMEVPRPQLAPAPVMAPDELDKEFDEAIAAVNEDDMLTPAQKRAEVVKLKDQREARADRRSQKEVNEQERIRNAEAARHGVSRQALDSAWDEAVNDCSKELGYFDANAAKLLMSQKLRLKKAATANNAASRNTAPATPPRDTSGRFAGGTQVAPAGGGVRSAGKRATPEKKFDREIERIMNG